MAQVGVDVGLWVREVDLHQCEFKVCPCVGSGKNSILIVQMAILAHALSKSHLFKFALVELGSGTFSNLNEY